MQVFLVIQKETKYCSVKTCVPFFMGERSYVFLLCIQGSTSESYSVMKEQVEKAKEEQKIQQKELEKTKKEVTSYSDVILRNKFVFFLLFLHGCSSFCQDLTLLQNREASDLQNQNVPLIFQLSGELHSHLWLARATSEAAFLQHTLTEAECLTKTHRTNYLLWPSLGRLLPPITRSKEE